MKLSCAHLQTPSWDVDNLKQLWTFNIWWIFKHEALHKISQSAKQATQFNLKVHQSRHCRCWKVPSESSTHIWKPSVGADEGRKQRDFLSFCPLAQTLQMVWTSALTLCASVSANHIKEIPGNTTLKGWSLPMVVGPQARHNPFNYVPLGSSGWTQI